MTLIPGIRGYNLSNSGLRGGDALVRKRVYLHVDQRRPIPSSSQTAEVRNNPNKDAMSVLDGVHLDLRSHAVLSSFVGLQQAALRSRCVHLHAGLGEHGSVLSNAGHFGIRPKFDHHRLHLLVHILHDAKVEKWSSHPWQGIRDSAIRKLSKSQSYYVLCTGDDLLALLVAVYWREVIWILHWNKIPNPFPAFCNRLVGDVKLILEESHPSDTQSAV